MLFLSAMERADVALGLKPDDPEAMKLRNDARRESELVDAAQKQEQAYQAAMAAAKSAFEAKDYDRAMAQADVALGLKPDDPEATKLRNDARRQNSVRAGGQDGRNGVSLMVRRIFCLLRVSSWHGFS